MKSRLTALVLAAAMALGLATQAAQPARADAPDELVIGITQYPANLHPIIDSMMAKSYVLGFTRRPLTIHNQDWELTCLLCTKLPSITNGLAEPIDLEDGSQGVKMTFTIQPEATWGDGTPVTSKDAVFTWEVGRHPQSGVANAELFRRITKIEVQDAKTFTLYVDRLTYDYNAMNDFRLLPEHLERPVFEANPADYHNKTLYQTDSTNKGLYFGPYRITAAVSGSHVVLEPNDTWYGDKPYFKRITVRTIEKSAALEANLLSGAVDMVAGELGFPIDQGVAFEERHAEGYQIIFKPSLIYEHVDLNLDNPKLQDKRVRQALLYGLDRETMTMQLFGGYQPVALSFVHPLDWIYKDDVPAYPHDPDKAKALLDEAGWTEMKDGIRHKDGEPLSFEIMTTAGDHTRERVQQVLQSEWKALGVDVRIRNQPARVLFGETLRERKFESMILYAWLSSPANVPRLMLHSDEIPTEDNNFSGENFPGFKNEEIDKLTEELETTLDVQERLDMWHRLQEVYAEELPVLPMFYRANMYILPTWLEGLVPTGHQYPSSLWVENWRARK